MEGEVKRLHQSLLEVEALCRERDEELEELKAVAFNAELEQQQQQQGEIPDKAQESKESQEAASLRGEVRALTKKLRAAEAAEKVQAEQAEVHFKAQLKAQMEAQEAQVQAQAQAQTQAQTQAQMQAQTQADMAQMQTQAQVQAARVGELEEQVRQLSELRAAAQAADEQSSAMQIETQGQVASLREELSSQESVIQMLTADREGSVADLRSSEDKLREVQGQLQVQLRAEQLRAESLGTNEAEAALAQASEAASQAAVLHSLQRELQECREQLQRSEGAARVAEAAQQAEGQQQVQLKTQMETQMEVQQVQMQAQTQAQEQAQVQSVARVGELEGVVGTLTSKLKDLMQRYAEQKSSSVRAQGQVQVLEAQLADLTSLAQAKDSEILGFRMKMERVEQSSSDHRLKAGELADRHSEAQKELTKLREGLGEKQRLLEEALRSCERAEEGQAAAQEQQKEVLQRLTEASDRCSQLEGASVSTQREVGQVHERQLRGVQEQVAQLQAELASTSQQLQAGVDSAGSLDNYKKRAQLALKKANAAAATLTLENEQLRSQAEESLARAEEAQQGAREAAAEEEGARRDLHSAEDKLQQLQEQGAAESAARAAAEQKHAATVAGRDAKIRELQAALTALTEVQRRPHHMPSSPPPSAPSFTAAPSAAITAKPTEAPAPASPEVLPPVEQLSVQVTPPRLTSWARAAASDNDTKSEAEAAAGVGPFPPHAAEEDPFSPFPTGQTDSLVFVARLQTQVEALRRDLAQRGIDLEAAVQEGQYERDEKRVLKDRVAELVAYLDRAKTREGADAATNMEYLKTCVLRFMSSTEAADRRRLYPVIAALLKLTPQEVGTVEAALRASEERDNEFQNTLSSIGSFASTSLGSFWGGT